MSTELLLAFLTFAVATLFTPGPNNVMLMASALNFGFRRTLPHLLGVVIGFSLLVALVGFGLGRVFLEYPVAYTALKYAGVAYLLYLAFAIARSGPVDAGTATRGRPMSFFGAAMFQWVNVKGWVIAVGAITTFAGLAPFPSNVAIQAGLLFAVGLCSSATWAAFGSGLRRVLSTPRAVRVFNIAMALALVVSLVPVLWEPSR